MSSTSQPKKNVNEIFEFVFISRAKTCNMHFWIRWSINKYFVICFISSSIYKSKQITKFISNGLYLQYVVVFVMRIKLIDWWKTIISVRLAVQTIKFANKAKLNKICICSDAPCSQLSAGSSEKILHSDGCRCKQRKILVPIQQTNFPDKTLENIFITMRID